MSNKFNWKDGVGALLFVLLVAGGLINSVVAANTHAVDLERGSSQLLSITDGSQTGLDLSSALTIEAWVKLESLPTTGQSYVIASKREGVLDNRQYSFYVENFGGTDKLTLLITSHGNNVDYVGRISWSPSVDTWYHIAATWSNSSQTYTAYINGSSIGTDDTSGSNLTSIYDGTAEFRIGAEEAVEINFFDGLIDEVRVWDVERTQSQIAADMSHELTGSELSLVGYWKLNNSLNDFTSNGNNLTNNNGVVFSSDRPFGEPPPPPFTEILEVRKDADQSLSGSTALQADNDLTLSLAANKTYIVDGIIFVSSTKAKPDVKISFVGQPGSTVTLGYITDQDGGVLTSDTVSPRIVLPANSPIPIQIKGTVKTGATAGNLEFKWAQMTANVAPTTILGGSYLRAEEI